MELSSSLTEYYERRAYEYDKMYAKPEIQGDLAELKVWLAKHVCRLRLLEVACGTGYWTAVAATTAQSIQAIDINPAPLAIARSKGIGCHVKFAQADAYSFPSYDAKFDCGMAHLWWSHVPKGCQFKFLSHFVSKLAKGNKLLMIDNNFVPGITKLSRTDEYGNTYQVRTLQSGEQYEVLKNFPTRCDLEAALCNFWSNVSVIELRHFWGVSAQDPL
jgi:demethylmenaquinone methyltransferase/2-methoxy-6-polyprenyl-1,4-benzoquinol methylase